MNVRSVTLSLVLAGVIAASLAWSPNGVTAVVAPASSERSTEAKPSPDNTTLERLHLLQGVQPSAEIQRLQAAQRLGGQTTLHALVDVETGVVVAALRATEEQSRQDAALTNSSRFSGPLTNRFDRVQ